MKFSVVSAVCNVAPYLPDFLDSLDAQTHEHTDIEVILVDDGSTDSTPQILTDWAVTTDYSVQIVRQENAGQAAARNSGIELACGKWITFPDPDDILDSKYFEAVAAGLEANDGAVFAYANLLDFYEAKGAVTNTHPLRFRFRSGNSFHDLDRFPRNIHLHAASAFFRLGILNDFAIRFDSRIRPNFEDGHLVQVYLLSFAERMVFACADASYIYRRRATGDSTLQTSASDPRKYSNVLEFGYLDLLNRASAKGAVPRWLQNVVLYDLFWILRSEESLFPKTGSMGNAVGGTFAHLMSKIVEQLDDDSVQAFDLIRTSPTQREALRHGFIGRAWHSSAVKIDRYDRHRELVRIVYRYVGEPPEELLYFRGLPAQPMHAKNRSLVYVNIPIMHERILWISARGTVQVRLNGRVMPMVFSEQAEHPRELTPSKLDTKFPAPRPHTPAIREKRRSSDVPLAQRFARWMTFGGDSAFDDAWVFMDRPYLGSDNAEHLFRWVRANRPAVNAWFVLTKTSPDWKRLRAEFGDRLVAHGSARWRALCSRATLLLSSHADAAVINPVIGPRGERPRWDFVFLQHGVTKDNLSRWFNTKKFRALVAATEQEYNWLVGNGGEFTVTSKEVFLTGFPRFDRLSELADQSDLQPARRCVTFMPTWRQYLKRLPDESIEVWRGRFVQSEYFAQWNALLGNPRIHSAAEDEQGALRIMIHPEMEDLVSTFQLPPRVQILRYGSSNVQEVIASTTTLVTDYSSVAFDAAFAGRSVVYYQFDRQTVFGGGHLTRPGYFSYDDHGFGPVARTLDDGTALVVDAIRGVTDDGELYAERRKATFTMKRAGNCERVFRAVEKSMARVSPRTGTTLQLSVEAPPAVDLNQLVRS